ncbi:O-acetyl-ADP-ribose deacetylase 1, partial [Golovinomyces cichoracearum]
MVNVNSTEQLYNSISYDDFMHNNDQGVIFNFSIQQVNKDLFSDYFDETFHLVHCVSQDFEMNSGISIKFKNKYDHVNELKAQNKTKKLFIIYLITKSTFYEKSAYKPLFTTLKLLKIFCSTYNINKIAIPKITFESETLNWCTILNMIKYIF